MGIVIGSVLIVVISAIVAFFLAYPLFKPIGHVIQGRLKNFKNKMEEENEQV